MDESARYGHAAFDEQGDARGDAAVGRDRVVTAVPVRLAGRSPFLRRRSARGCVASSRYRPITHPQVRVRNPRSRTRLMADLRCYRRANRVPRTSDLAARCRTRLEIGLIVSRPLDAVADTWFRRQTCHDWITSRRDVAAPRATLVRRPTDGVDLAFKALERRAGEARGWPLARRRASLKLSSSRRAAKRQPGGRARRGTGTPHGSRRSRRVSTGVGRGQRRHHVEDRRRPRRPR